MENTAGYVPWHWADFLSFVVKEFRPFYGYKVNFNFIYCVRHTSYCIRNGFFFKYVQLSERILKQPDNGSYEYVVQ